MNEVVLQPFRIFRVNFIYHLKEEKNVNWNVEQKVEKNASSPGNGKLHQKKVDR